MYYFKLNQGKIYLMIMLLLVLLLTHLVPTIRTAVQGTPILGSETFYHLNNEQNPTSFYEQIIHFIISKIGVIKTINYLPLLLAIISLLLFSTIIKYYLETDTQYYYAILLLITSPVFLTSHIGLTTTSIITSFSLISFWLYKKKSYFYLISLAFLFLINPLIGSLFSIYFIQDQFTKENWTGVGILISASLVFITTSLTQSLNQNVLATNLMTLNINDMFYFFGADYGLTIILFLLTIIGLQLNAREYFKETLISVFVIFFTFIYKPARLLGFLMIVYFASTTIDYIVKKRWESKLIKQLTIILIICLIIFSTTTFIQDGLVKPPTKNQIQTLKFIAEDKASLQNKILVLPQEAEFTRYYSNKNIIASEYSTNNKTDLVKKLYLSRTYTWIKPVLQKEKVAFILIDSEVMNLLKKPDEGLLFIMNHNDDFVKITDLNDVKLYYFKEWNQD